MAKKTRKSKTTKRSKRIRNKKSISKKYYGNGSSEALNSLLSTTGSALDSIDKAADKAQDFSKGITNAAAKATGVADHIANTTSDIASTGTGVADHIVNSTSDLTENLAKDVAQQKDVTQQHIDDFKNKLNKAHNDIINESDENLHEKVGNIHQDVLDKHKELLSKQDEIKKQLLDVGGIDMGKLTYEEALSEIQKMKNSEDEKTVKNALALENALKMHEELKNLLENPLIQHLVESSTEAINKLGIVALKFAANEVTGAASSIPIVGELFVLERMLRNGLESISDANESTKEVQDNVKEAKNALDLVEKVKFSGGGMHRIYASIDNFLKSSRLG